MNESLTSLLSIQSDHSYQSWLRSALRECSRSLIQSSEIFLIWHLFSVRCIGTRRRLDVSEQRKKHIGWNHQHLALDSGSTRWRSLSNVNEGIFLRYMQQKSNSPLTHPRPQTTTSRFDTPLPWRKTFLLWAGQRPVKDVPRESTRS